MNNLKIRCYVCKNEKDINEFYDNKLRKNGKSNKCKECSKEKLKEWRKNNPDKCKEQNKTKSRKISNSKYQKNNRDKINAKRRQKRKEDENYRQKEILRSREDREKNYEKYKLYHAERQLRKFYNISVEEKKKMYDQQNGQCFLCKKTVDFFKICVDHCHKTGKVRNLLCVCCNSGLAMAKESIQTLEAMIEYIKKHTS